MGNVATLDGKRLYLDANIFIYAVEQHPEFFEGVRSVFQLIADQRAASVTSDLTLGEVLIQPIRMSRTDQQEGYVRIMANTRGLEVCPITKEIVLSAAQIRAESNTTFADALHLATAQEQLCDVFVTNDKRLKVPSGIQRFLIGEL